MKRVSNETRKATATMAKNKYREKKYDRIEMVVPKGTKEKLKEIISKSENNSLNSYIMDAVKEKYKRETGKEIEL